VRRFYAGRTPRSEYAIVNPRGELVYAGRLTLGDVDAILDSPARRQFGPLMAAGNIVLLLLEGKDAAANQAAERTAQEVVRLVEEGKLDAPLRARGPDLGAVDLAPRKSDGDARPPTGQDRRTSPKAALLKVSRADAQEAWLVRMLMRADQDLDEVADQPMVFPIYGRARALPPCIGGGITKENLLDDGFGLGFLAGPCSCEVKDGNPGTDLLTSIAWPPVASRMATVYGDEESADAMGDVTSLVPRVDRLSGPSSSAQSPVGGNQGASSAAVEDSGGGADSAGASEDAGYSPAWSPLRMVGVLVAIMAVAAVLGSFALRRARP
jgi:hypothetical protein